MNRVGEKGKGESVWLGWFLQTTLVRFAPVAAARGEQDRATRWLAHAASLKTALEQAWDGDWYRRGYFDDGTPLGSALSDECRIDSIAQSWSVISGAGAPERAARAMSNVDSQLVQEDAGLVLLFTPPFDHTPHDPGYIKGYPPGIRENGGQYTHAATWTVIAQAVLGNGERAAKLFALLNPITHSSTRPTSTATRSSRMWWRRTSIQSPPRGARRLDVVHRIGQLDVPRRSRVDPGISGAGGQTAAGAVHTAGLASLRHRLPACLRAL